MLVCLATKSLFAALAFSLSSSSVLWGVVGTRNNPLTIRYDNTTYEVDPGHQRDPYNNLPSTTNSACGETCKGSNQYNFGLYACLKSKLGIETGIPPNITLTFPSVILKQKLNKDTKEYETDQSEVYPKVIFSPTTTFSDNYNSKHYNSVRRGGDYWSPMPAAIVFAEKQQDVKDAINCARENGYRVSPRGRGHDFFSANGGIDGAVVVDMQLTCKKEDFEKSYDRAGQQHIIPGSEILGEIRIPAGCTNAVQLARTNDLFGDESLTLIGSCPSVGVVGYLLNGGGGDTNPYLGMGADLIESIDMVLYDGTNITVKRDDMDKKHRDIFFATAGGTGGLGIVTSFTELVLKNPGGNKVTLVEASSVDFAPSADWFMTLQDFLYNDIPGVESESYLFGGNADLRSLSGIFLGSERKLNQVFERAGLTNPAIRNPVPKWWLPQVPLALQPAPDYCNPGHASHDPIKCLSEFTEPYSSLSFSNQRDAQLYRVCYSTNVPSAIHSPNTGRGFNICEDLGLDNSYCCNWDNPSDPTWPISGACNRVIKANEILKKEVTRVNVAKCGDPRVLEAYAKAADNPKSFLNKANLAKEIVEELDRIYEYFNEIGYNTFIPEVSVFGSLTPVQDGQGVGGLMIPRLQKSTIEEFVNFERSKEASKTLTMFDNFFLNHLQHGASMMLPHFTNGYAHRNTGSMTNSMTRSPEFVDILLKDPAYKNDVKNLQIYMNYSPSRYLPQIESLAYGYEHSAELSRIRTEYDPHGIFDSPRYVQRNRRSWKRSVPQYPSSDSDSDDQDDQNDDYIYNIPKKKPSTKKPKKNGRRGFL